MIKKPIIEQDLTKNTSLFISHDSRNKLKRICKYHGISMKDYLCDFIDSEFTAQENMIKEYEKRKALIEAAKEEDNKTKKRRLPRFKRTITYPRRPK